MIIIVGIITDNTFFFLKIATKCVGFVINTIAMNINVITVARKISYSRQSIVVAENTEISLRINRILISINVIPTCFILYRSKPWRMEF